MTRNFTTFIAGCSLQSLNGWLFLSLGVLIFNSALPTPIASAQEVGGEVNGDVGDGENEGCIGKANSGEITSLKAPIPAILPEGGLAALFPGEVTADVFNGPREQTYGLGVQFFKAIIIWWPGLPAPIVLVGASVEEQIHNKNPNAEFLTLEECEDKLDWELECVSTLIEGYYWLVGVVWENAEDLDALVLLDSDKVLFGVSPWDQWAGN
jgi:hypothetical protein